MEIAQVMICRKGILLCPHQFEQEGETESSWPEPQEQSKRGWIKCCLGESFVRRQVGNRSEVDVREQTVRGRRGDRSRLQKTPLWLELENNEGI